jgi:hypothetical protein
MEKPETDLANTPASVSSENETKITEQEQEIAAGKMQEEMAVSADPIAIQDPEALPVRIKQEIEKPNFDEVIYPVPNTSFIIAMELIKEEEKNALAPEVRTFSFNLGERSTLQPLQERPENLEALESEFYEILWITQETNILTEQRNIWLSYLSRETDPTFRSLAIFNLAWVLSKIAEETRNPVKAKEALDFLKEHQESLRFQMKQRFEEKVGTLLAIINGN